ncbi:MAG: phytoene/squalene synthase family protein [Haloferacaceae archaeon]
MVADDSLRASREIQKETGRTFYLATRLFPPRIREATHVLYAFFRRADDVVDEPGEMGPEAQRRAFERLRAVARGDEEPSDPVMAAFREVSETYSIPDAEVDRFLSAMEADVTKSRYETYDELDDYMRGSAAAVGNMMTAVMGADDPAAAKPHAEALGKAFQMTNFLRDVREDVVDHGRIYLPRTTLDRHGVAEDDVTEFRPTPGFREAMAAELRRTEALYRAGVAGIRHLPADCQFPVLLAAVYSAEYHRLIRARDYDVLSSTPRLDTGRMLLRLARLRWHWRHRDPESAFYAVSAVSRTPEEDPATSTFDRIRGLVSRPHVLRGGEHGE